MTWKRCKSAPETFRESPLRSLLWPSPFPHHCRHHHHHHHHHHHFDLNSTNRKYTIAILILLLTFSTSKIIIPFAASHHESLKETWAKSLQAICWPRKYKRRVKITGGAHYIHECMRGEASLPCLPALPKLWPHTLLHQFCQIKVNLLWGKWEAWPLRWK